MVLVIFIVVALLILIAAGVIAFALPKFGDTIEQNEAEIEANKKQEGKKENGRVASTSTMGFDIPEGDSQAQIKAARILAAKQAASMPRGANITIGSLGNPTFASLTSSLANDPWSAAKIAEHHGWAGVQTGHMVKGVTTAAKDSPAETTQIEPPTLIEITADMDKEAKRAARLANMKAKSAYKKALKAAGIDPKAAAASPAKAAPAAKANDPASGIAKPKLIELTADMDKETKRAARLANMKAKSAYKKALKAAGIDPKSVA